MKFRGLLNAHEENNQAHNGDEIAGIAEPQAVLGVWSGASLRTPVHPVVGKRTSHLFTEYSTDDNSNELQA